MVGVRNFQDTFETRKRLFVSPFSIYMTVPLKMVFKCTSDINLTHILLIMCHQVSLKIGTSYKTHWRHSDFFIVNFEQISHIALVFLLLTLII